MPTDSCVEAICHLNGERSFDSKFNRGARLETKVRRAAKSGTGLQFNEDVLLTEDLQKNFTPVPDFTSWADRMPVTACNCRFWDKFKRLRAADSQFGFVLRFQDSGLFSSVRTRPCLPD